MVISASMAENSQNGVSRSLNATFEHIVYYLKDLNYEFDIIAISETWLLADNVDNY